jgi:hypothetical protein
VELTTPPSLSVVSSLALLKVALLTISLRRSVVRFSAMHGVPEAGA